LDINDRYYKKMVKEIDENIVRLTSSHRKLINEAITDLVNGGGKRLRPVLMLISASFGNYDKEKLLNLAAGLEILHMASLIHDDIIDDANLRRGQITTQERFGKNTAVFIGDFLLTKTFSVFIDHLDEKVLAKMNKIVRLLCEGEVEQEEKRFDFSIDLTDYLRRIRRKTALLFALSTFLGAYQSGKRGKSLHQFYKLGLELGMAFQIQDDILDFTGDEVRTGKKSGQDLLSGVVTIPVIYMLDKNEYRQKAIPLLEKDILSYEDVNQLMDLCRASGSIEESQELLKRFIDRVLYYFEPLPETKVKKRLQKIIDFQLERNF